MSPIDTLFFRDGKSFNIMEDNWAENIFPPYPLTIYGALRAEYFSNNLNDFPKRESEEDPSLNLKINGIYLSVHGQVYAPLPNDIVIAKGKQNSQLLKLILLDISKNKEVLSSYDYKYILKAESEVENIKDAWIRLEDLVKYLNNDLIYDSWSIEPEDLKEEISKDYTIIRLSNHILNEPKIGIRLSQKTGTVMEHYLYSLNRTKLIDIKIIVDFEGLDFPNNGILRLGGRNGKIYFETLTNKTSEFNQIKNYKTQKEEFIKQFHNEGKSIIKLYFKTPTIFQNYDKPDFQKHLRAKYEVISCALDKHINVGGFNMKEGRPRPMFKALKAGALYYLKINNQDLKNIDINTNLSDQWKKRGFGIYSIGHVNINNN